MNWYSLLSNLLFRLDPEQAHSLACGVLRGAELLLSNHAVKPPGPDGPLAQSLWGVKFTSPVGLAAGFDKNAEFPHVWQALGFGFAELGTVTAHAQPGNPSPRLFRLPADRALINRLGFNNDGAEAVALRLEKSLSQAGAGIPLGINLGKSRITSVNEAASDYRHSFRRLAPFAAYIVVNVSSPNTPGLRDLQAEEHLSALLEALQKENLRMARQGEIDRPRPLLVKLAPDLADAGIAAVVRAARENGAVGLVATNTTIRREGLQTPIEEAGGLSGAPLRARSTAVIRQIRTLAGSSLSIIGVGGIFTAEDAWEKIRAGASLVQLYTGFIYRGPSVAHDITMGLERLLQRSGFTRLSDAVGSDA